MVSLSFEVCTNTVEHSCRLQISVCLFAFNSGAYVHSKCTRWECHAGDSSNILTNDPSGPAFLHSTEHVRPEVTVILRASSLPSMTERLAWESTGEYIDPSSVSNKVCCCDIVQFVCVWKMVSEHLLRE